jgi:hypothetical protein
VVEVPKRVRKQIQSLFGACASGFICCRSLVALAGQFSNSSLT